MGFVNTNAGARPIAQPLFGGGNDFFGTNVRDDCRLATMHSASLGESHCPSNKNN